MKLDNERLRIYAKLPDSILWSQIVALGAKHGVSLPKATPPKEDMARLRSIMTGEVQLSLSEALNLVNNYKKKSGGTAR